MPSVLVIVTGAIGEIVFNKPEKLNALDADMLRQFSAALESLAANDEVRAIIIRGEGKSFSVGYDIGGATAGGYGNGSKKDAYSDWTRIRDSIKRWLAVWECSKPVIAQIHGHCMGGATLLAVLCDLTMIAEDAAVGWPSLPLGAGLLGPPSNWLIGPKKAKELSFIAGSRMTGVEAVQLGWANHAYPEAELGDATRALVRRICKTPPDFLALKKRAHNRVLEMQGFTESVLMGADFDAIAHFSASYNEAKSTIAEIGLKGAITRFRDSDTL